MLTSLNASHEEISSKKIKTKPTAKAKIVEQSALRGIQIAQESQLNPFQDSKTLP